MSCPLMKAPLREPRSQPEIGCISAMARQAARSTWRSLDRSLSSRTITDAAATTCPSPVSTPDAGSKLASGSRGEFEDLADLRRSGDRARVLRHPRRAHRLLGHPVEALRPDLHRAEAARHAEPGDEAVEHLGGILAGMPHRGGDQCLARRIDR